MTEAATPAETRAPPDLASAVAARLRDAVPRFLAIHRHTAATAGDGDGFEAARDLLSELRALAPGDDPALDAALGRPSASAIGAMLAAVLRALIAEDAGDAEKALRHARAATRINSRPLLPQRLVARLEGRSEDGDLAQRFCAMPWETFETQPGGDVHVCCPTWLPATIGNLDEATPEAIWNGPAARDIRRSILDGSYRYCSRVYCPHIANRTLPRRDALVEREHRRIVAENDPVARRRPRYAVLSHDRSCNLSCPPCRTERLVARKDEQDRLDRLLHATLMPLLRDARRVTVTGSGDPLASAHFRDVLLALSRLSEPRPKVTLHTNGQLLDARAWDELGLEGLADMALISIDAATPETYRSIRRGGELDRLLANLAFVASLRRRGSLRRVRLDCVVQDGNVEELAAIVRIARELGLDGVKFQMLRNWGTWSPAAFAEHHVGDPQHARYTRLLAALRGPLLAADEIEFFGMAQALREARHPRAAATAGDAEAASAS